MAEVTCKFTLSWGEVIAIQQALESQAERLQKDADDMLEQQGYYSGNTHIDLLNCKDMLSRANEWCAFMRLRAVAQSKSRDHWAERDAELAQQ